MTEQERIARAAERIADSLEAIVEAIGPGDGGRNSVTILDQLCAISDDTQAMVNRMGG
jgi:hypothetical protein